MRDCIWSDDYKLGDPRMDAQHEALFTSVAALLEDPDLPVDSEAFTHAMSNILLHVHQHFAMEEQLMLQHHYPDFDRHRDHHHGFIKALALISRDAMRRDKRATQQLRDLVIRLRLDHILTDDRAMVNYLRDCAG